LSNEHFHASIKIVKSITQKINLKVPNLQMK